MTGRRVAVVGPLTFPNPQGGMSRHCEEIYSILAGRGIDVTVLAVNRPHGASYRGMRVRRVPSLRHAGWDRLAYSFLSSLLAALGPYDVVHYHSFAVCGFSFVPRLTGKQVVVTIHRREWQDAKWGRLTRWYLRASEWLALHVAQRRVAVSEPLRDDLLERFPDAAPIEVMANGVTIPPRSTPDRLAAWDLEPDRFVLVVGRLVPEKGVDLVLDAWESLSEAQTGGFALVIAGSARHRGAFVAQLEKRAARSRPDAPVRLLGLVPHEALDVLYQHARTLVSASYQEGQPLALLEAMANECCVVASDIDAHRELLGSAGVLFPSGDATALAHALGAVLGDASRARGAGAAGRRIVEETPALRWDVAADSVQELLA